MQCMHMGNSKPICCHWARSGFSDSECFLCHFRQEGVQTIFLRRVNSHWHVLSWYDAAMVNATGWRWQRWLHLPARRDSVTLPPPRLRLPQSAFAPVLDQMHDHRRPGAALQATKITWSNAMQFFSYGDMLRTLYTTSTTGSTRAAKMNHHCSSELDSGMLQCVWTEMDCQFDICYITRGGHIDQENWIPYFFN